MTKKQLIIMKRLEDLLYYLLLFITLIMGITVIVVTLQKPTFSKTDCFGYNDKTYCAKVDE
jgi:hypothetical protein